MFYVATTTIRNGSRNAKQLTIWANPFAQDATQHVCVRVILRASKPHGPARTMYFHSLYRGRWSEQSARLHEGYRCIFFIIEGDLRDCEGVGIPYNGLWSACLNTELRKSSHLIRTWDVNETAAVVRLLVQKGGSPPAIPSGVAPKTALTKRKRDADAGLVFMRQLMCIPTVSENVARKLHDEFRTLAQLQKALLSPKTFPKIELDGKRRLGKVRIEKLAAYLL